VTLPPLWRQIQRQNFTRLDLLAEFLELNPDQRARLCHRPRYPLNLPQRLAQKIAKGTLDDPILRQFVPLQEEGISSSDPADPVNELAALQCSKLLKKYHGRALLLAASACAMHCRYCFRQNFPYETKTDFSHALQTIAADSSIEEIILSGGDPLSLSNGILRSLFASLADIPHLRRLRIHTRFPIGIPERIDSDLLSLFSNHPQQIVFVIHANHPRELDADVLASLRQIRCPLLSQSVLLKGVNDDEETLLTLCRLMVNNGIVPYYLHLLDKVAGSGHFEVSEERGHALIAYLQKHMSGYGVPRLARETPGEPSKTYI
jgi:EF-P beta-lysylation protein EpmB